MEESFLTIAGSLLDVILANPNIWIPVLGAWMAGFFSTRYLNLKNIRSQAEREWMTYKVNGGVAFVAYLIFNYQAGFGSLQQATLAAAVAVLIPAAWFRYKRDKG